MSKYKKVIPFLICAVALAGCGKKKKPASIISSSPSVESYESILSNNDSTIISSDNSINSNDINNSSDIYNDMNIEDFYGGYYNSLSSWNNGEDLKNKLKTIISKDFKKVKYTSNWTPLQIADQSQTNFDFVEEVYSTQEQLKDETYNPSINAYGWQKEHAFCQSLMGHYVSTLTTGITIDENYKLIEATILNNSFSCKFSNGYTRDGFISFSITNLENNNATLSIANNQLISKIGSTSTNLYALENIKSFHCDENDDLYIIVNDEDVKLGKLTKVNYKTTNEGSGGVATDFHNLFAANNSGNGSRGNKNLGVVTNNTASADKDYRYDEKVFEPSDTDKGLLARGILYMDTLYDDLTLQEDYVYLNQVLTSNVGCHGNKSTIISWADTYPINYHEFQHNEGVYSLQNNRNPYIDFPSLVDYVYGDKKNQSGTVSDLFKDSTQVLLKTNEKEYKNLAIEGAKYTYEVGDKFSLNDVAHIYTTYTNLTKEEVQDRSYISVSVSEGFSFDQIGKKDIVLSDGNTSVTYTVNVVDRDVTEDCEINRRYVVDGSAVKDEFKDITPTNSVVTDVDGIDFLTEIESGGLGTSSQKGVGFGSTAKPVNTLTLTSQSPVVKVDKNSIETIYINASKTTSGKATLKVYVNDEQVGDVISLTQNATLYAFDVSALENVDSNIKIEFSDVTATVYIAQIAIKLK